MSHVRTQVRTAIKALLAPIPGITVFQNLARAPNENELPVMTIRTESEDSDQDSSDEDIKRDLTIVVKIMAESSDDNVDDVLDDFAVEVENKLINQDLGGLLFDEPRLTNTKLELIEEGAMKIAFLHMTYTATYITTADNPETVG